MKRRLIAALATVLLAAPACQTLETFNDPDLEGSPVYSGTQRNATYIGTGLLNFSFLMMFVGLIDLPLSLVADTLLLPVTVPRANARAAEQRASRRVDVDLPSPVSARPGESPLDVARRLFETCRERTEALDPSVADCYAVDARVQVTRNDTVRTLTGAQYKIETRRRLPDLKYAGDYVTWRNERYEAEGDAVRVTAEQANSFSPERIPVTFLIGRGDDGQWRIVEEAGPGWP